MKELDIGQLACALSGLIFYLLDLQNPTLVNLPTKPTKPAAKIKATISLRSQ